MDLSHRTIQDDAAAVDAMRFKLLAQATKRAVSHQLKINPNKAIVVSVQPTKWSFRALLSHWTPSRAWPMLDSPFDGMLLGQDARFYMPDGRDERTVSVFEVTTCAAHDVQRIIEILQDMTAPDSW